MQSKDGEGAWSRNSIGMWHVRRVIFKVYNQGKEEGNAGGKRGIRILAAIVPVLWHSLLLCTRDSVLHIFRHFSRPWCKRHRGLKARKRPVPRSPWRTNSEGSKWYLAFHVPFGNMTFILDRWIESFRDWASWPLPCRKQSMPSGSSGRINECVANLMQEAVKPKGH